MSSIPTEAAALPTPGPDSGTILGKAAAPPPQDGTFEGDLEADEYAELVLVDMKARTRDNKFKPGTTKDEIVWLFAAVGQEDKGHLPWYTSFSLHEKSHFPGTCEALGKPVPADGEPVRKETYIGARCRGMIEARKSKNTGTEYMAIAKLSKAKK